MSDSHLLAFTNQRFQDVNATHIAYDGYSTTQQYFATHSLPEAVLPLLCDNSKPNAVDQEKKVVWRSKLLQQSDF